MQMRAQNCMMTRDSRDLDAFQQHHQEISAIHPILPPVIPVCMHVEAYVMHKSYIDYNKYLRTQLGSPY